MTLKTRFFLILLGMALIPLSMAAFWQVYQQKTVRKNLFDLHQGVADFASAGVTEWFSNVNRRLAFVYEMERSSPARRSGEEMKIIQQAVAANSDILSLVILSREGRETVRVHDSRISVADLPADYSSDELVRYVSISSRASTGRVAIVGKYPALPLAYPISDARVVLLNFSLAQLWKRMATQTIGETGRVVVADKDGKLLPGQSGFDGIHAGDLKAALSGGDKGVVENLGSSSGALAGAYRRAEVLPWVVVSLQKRSDVMGPQERAVYGFLFFTFFSLAASLGAAYAVSQKISKPIVALMGSVKSAVLKDFGHQIPEQGWAEIRALTSAFNSMMAELKRYHALQVDKIIEEKTKAETLVNTIPDGVLLADVYDKVVYSNSTAVRLLGPAQSQGEMLLPASVRNLEFRKGLENVLREKNKSSSCDIELPSRSPGLKKFFRIFSTPYPLSDQKRRGRVVILRDVTGEKEMDNLKDEFFHMITHDMRSPLGTIQGYVEMLLKSVPPSPKTDKYFTNVMFSTRTLRGMVDDILNVNKLEAGRLNLQLQPVSAEELMRGIQGAYEPASNMKNVSIAVQTLSSPVVFEGDRPILERVIANLVGNALKFTPSGGTITLSCPSSDGDKTTLCVADTGPGIPEDKKEFIFEKFRQLEGHERMGYGLGLAMCKMAVELHGGRIWVESEPGKGSRFIFTISRNLKTGREA